MRTRSGGTSSLTAWLVTQGTGVSEREKGVQELPRSTRGLSLNYLLDSRHDWLPKYEAYDACWLKPDKVKGHLVSS